jgi:peroxiredoxin
MNLENKLFKLEVYMQKKAKLLLLCTAAWLAMLASADKACAINVGDPFPPFSKENILTPEQCAYLHIAPDREFSLSDLSHDIIIIEFLNVYCHTCRMQVEIFNDLYKTIAQDPELNRRVCMIGIAVGNTPEEIQDFRKNFGALYPIFSDRDKAIFNMTGNVQGTPHTYILRKEEQRFIIDYHAGGVTSKDRYLNTVKFALRGSFAGTTPGNKVPAFAVKTSRGIVDEKRFYGKKLILYFPANKVYPVGNDTRNRKNQIKILMDINKNYPDVVILIVQYRGFSLPAALTTEAFLSGDPVDAQAMKQFRADSGPTVYYINEYGRIAFKDEGITLYNAQAIIQGKGEYKAVPEAKEEDIVNLLKNGIEKGGKKVVALEKEVLDNGNAIYVIALEPRRDGVFLFARLESKSSLCDICHDSHFFYVLDQDGFILDFFPLQLTKLGNVQWTDEDIAKIKKQIAGKNIFDTFPFDPKADAVSTATMSSSLVYESLNGGKNVFGQMKTYKFRYEYWKEICVKHMCAVRMKIADMKQQHPLPQLVVDDALLQTIAKELNVACPLDGSFMFLDGNILCSIHGMMPLVCK